MTRYPMAGVAAMRAAHMMFGIVHTRGEWPVSAAELCLLTLGDGRKSAYRDSSEDGHDVGSDARHELQGYGTVPRAPC